MLPARCCASGAQHHQLSKKRLPGRPGRDGSDRGFSLLEVVVALAVLSIVLVSVGDVLASQVTVTTSTKNQAVAQGLLTRTLATLRALPYPDLAKGLDAKDTTTGTAHIKKTGTTWVFNDSKDLRDGTGETVLHFTPGATPPPPAPLYPHLALSILNGGRFSVAVFPTQYETPPLNTPSHTAAVVPGLIRVTVIVSWGTGSGRPSTLIGQTLVSTVGRCDETTGTTGPCKPNFTAVATAGFGTITVAPAPGAPYPIEGVAFTSIALLLTGTSSSSDLVRTALVKGSAEATGASLTGASGGNQVSAVATQVSNDPASGDPTFQSKTLSQSAVAVADAGSGNSITATPSAGDSGNSVGTTSAQATQKCVLLAGTPQATSTPCGSGSAIQHSTAGIAARFQAATLGTAALATIGAQPVTLPDRTFAARVDRGQGDCPHAATSGCTGAAAQASLGTVVLGSLPGGVASPPGWSNSTGVISLSSFSAQATATATSGTSGTHISASASVPIPGAPTPELTYWNGTGYTTAAINGSSQSLTVPKVTAQDASAPGGTVTVTMTTVLFVDAISAQQSTTPACQHPCLTRKTVPSPLRATITYEAVQGATVLCDLLITVNLGHVAASASYQAAS
ncbi:MAG: prepilin-type N-terminal cleavage/methylation domain-containing protein [Acidimicrobiales bacterium]